MASDDSWGPALCEAAAAPGAAAAVKKEVKTDRAGEVAALQRELKILQAKTREQALFIALQDKQMEVVQRENVDLRQASLRTNSELTASIAKNTELQRALAAARTTGERRETHMKRLKDQVAALEIAHAQAHSELASVSQRGKGKGRKAQSGGEQEQKQKQKQSEQKRESNTVAASASESSAPAQKKGHGQQQQQKQQQKQKQQQQKKKKTAPAASAEAKKGSTASAAAASAPGKGKKNAREVLSASQAAVAATAKAEAPAQQQKVKKKKKKKKAPKQQQPKEEKLDGAAGFMVNMLTPGVQSDAISAMNWVFALLFVSIAVMIFFGKASFHFGVFGLLAFGLFASVQYYLGEAAKLDGVLNPTEEQLQKEAEDIKALVAKREAEKAKKAKK
eukprot:CAMPEP_0114621170 /NCGR_PEP_ID=MMETSP0168-20121206/9095_1 /TAXON_ID=95228 ORGANISM="Vannella sp., Strain DIVA3 517/6/12" /NCGR_SAMPLE_ID=MMETSP0168 /ASSEMBLY_ACC=CAM_ASM_000044 /LENGTH=391 /DNA_ID=CAMNT_0001832369 /DNA_START=8 /DNA_END=1183 /DNA_ORIENTATION=-